MLVFLKNLVTSLGPLDGTRVALTYYDTKFVTSQPLRIRLMDVTCPSLETSLKTNVMFGYF